MIAKVDFVEDNNPTAINHVVDNVGMPDYVKSAAHVEDSDYGDNAFAAPSRSLPVHTKAATWLSAAWLGGNTHRIPYDYATAKANIKQAAAAWGIEQDIDTIFQLHESTTKEASDEPAVSPEHALTVDFAGENNLGVQSYYSIKTASEVVDASIQSTREYAKGRLPIEFMRVASKAIVKKAAELNVRPEELTKNTNRLGSQGIPSFDNALKVAALRETWGGVPAEAMSSYEEIILGAKHAYEKAASVEEADAVVEKWAALWVEHDANNGVTYSSTVADPYSALFSGEKAEDVEKKASTMFVLRDVVIPMDELRVIDDIVVEQNLTKEASTAVKAVKAVLVDSADDLGTATAVTEHFRSISDSAQREVLSALAAS
jgi:hypothetical protein